MNIRSLAITLALITIRAHAGTDVCGCDSQRLPIRFDSDEDPLVEPGYGEHTFITGVRVIDGECVLSAEFASGETTTFDEPGSGTFLKYRLQSGEELTNEELITWAHEVCAQLAHRSPFSS